MGFIIIFALLLTAVNSTGLITGILSRPPDTVYLGMIHYYQDYFFYVNHFFQGAHGAWLTANRYTSEVTPPSIFYWINILMGKIGGLIGLSPIASYHTSLIVLTILIIFTVYLLLARMFPKSKIQAFIGFVFAFLSTSLMNHIYVDGKPMWYPFQLWRTPHFALLDRLASIPHQIFQTLLFLLLTMMCFTQGTAHRRTKLILIGILAFSLTSNNPIQAIIFLAAFIATQGVAYIQKKPLPFNRLLVLFLVTACTFVYINLLSETLPHSQARAWEGRQQTITSPAFLLLSIGPISILYLLGIIPSLLSGNAIFIFAIILTLGTYGLFLSNIPQAIGVSDLRFIFPALYPFMGAIAVNGVVLIAKKLAKIIPTMTTITIVMLLFILISLPTLYWEIQQKIQSQTNTKDQIIYLPSPIYDMFMALGTIGGYNDVVLANPNTNMDLLVPALSGHTTYSGHMLLTIRSEEKQLFGSQFFSLNKPDAESWIKANNIRYVLFTSLDGDIKRFIQTYPFLKIYKMFEDSAAIFAL
ncbi:hypothetical protein HY409_01365 [Candidatus Gottesmanbacteria bacterium]|nr:hypothetical protein [Candidatus Gottesmanbacteria bacterium]